MSIGNPTAKFERMVEVERDEPDLYRLVERRVEANRAVEDRLAIFGLANLQERGVLAAFNRIPGGIDEEQSMRLASDRSPHEQGGVEIHVFLFETFHPVASRSQGPADGQHGLIDAGYGLPPVDPIGFGVVHALGHPVHCALRGGQTA